MQMQVDAMVMPAHVYFYQCICITKNKLVIIPDVPRPGGPFSNRNLHLYVWFKYDLGQMYYAPQVRPDRGSNS